MFAMGFPEIVVVLVVVVIGIHLYQRRTAKTPSGGGRPLADVLREDVGRAAQRAHHTFQGQHGKAWQVIGMLVLLTLVWLWGRDFAPARLLYVVVAIVGIAYLYRSFSHSNRETIRRNATPPVPPPLPPEAFAIREPESLHRPHRTIGPLKFVMFTMAPLAFFVLLFFGLYLLQGRPHGMRMIEIQRGRHIVESIEADEDFDPSELIAKATDIHRVADVPTPAPPPTPKAPNSAAVDVPKTPVIPSTDLPTPKLHKSSTGVELASLTTEPFPSEVEARQAAMLLASQYLSQIILQKGLVYTDWRPSLNWTSRNFIESLEIEKVERGDLSVFVGHADIRVPDEKKVEQIWNEFVKDKAAGRSLLMLKVFAGAVFMAGGFAILLRLGTGRHVAQEPVSLKRRWFGQKEPANR